MRPIAVQLDKEVQRIDIYINMIWVPFVHYDISEHMCGTKMLNEHFIQHILRFGRIDGTILNTIVEYLVSYGRHLHAVAGTIPLHHRSMPLFRRDPGDLWIFHHVCCAIFGLCCTPHAIDSTSFYFFILIRLSDAVSCKHGIRPFASAICNPTRIRYLVKYGLLKHIIDAVCRSDGRYLFRVPFLIPEFIISTTAENFAKHLRIIAEPTAKTYDMLATTSPIKVVICAYDLTRSEERRVGKECL